MEEPVLTRLAALAQDQDGCVSSTQLTTAGIGSRQQRSLVERGAMTRVVRGVFVVASAVVTQRQLLRCALLLGGPKTVASHYSALALHGLIDEVVGEAWVTVHVPSGRGERKVATFVPVAETGRPGVIHLFGARFETRAGLRHGISVMQVAGALVFAASALTPAAMLRVWREADYRGLLREAELRRAFGRGKSGSSTVRQLLEAHPIVVGPDTDVRTRGEFLLLEAVLLAGIPRPLTNAPLVLPGTTYYPDQFHARERLVVEVDGGVHRTDRRRREDAARDAHMRANGIDVLRIDDADVRRDPEAAADRVGHRLIERRRHLDDTRRPR